MAFEEPAKFDPLKDVITLITCLAGALGLAVVIMLFSLPAGVGKGHNEGLFLVTSKGCMECHHATRTKIGPSFKDVAKHAREDGEEVSEIAEEIRLGGKGQWGDAVMPPQPHVSKAEALEIANWILGGTSH